MQNLLQRIKELFEEQLKTKTGWGRNEVIAAYDAAVLKALMERIK